MKLYEIIENAVNDGINLALDKYDELKAKKFDSLFIPKHEDFPSISNFSSGLPCFSTTPAYFGLKVNYKKILSDNREDIKLNSWNVLVDFFMNDKGIYNYIKWKDWNPPNEKEQKEIYTYSIYEKLRSLIDSIIHSTTNPRNKSKTKSEKISKWVKALTKNSVNYELVIPIIFHQPDCQKITLDKNIRIQRLDNKLQLSRHNKLPENIVAHKNVVGAATHAIFISNVLRNVPNENQSKKHDIIKQRIDENFDLITKIFSTFRMVLKESIGFCQVIAISTDFEEDWLAQLPGIEVFGFKKYPPSFEINGWHEQRVISKKQLQLIKKYYNKITDDTKIRLAKLKLFDSDLRTNKHDSILDLATGFELLLSDSTDNLKYKISLRAAAICKKKKLLQFTPVEVKIGVKTFYDFRSAIVHGNTSNISKYKNVTLDRFQPIETLWFGRIVLIHLIEYLMFNSEFRNTDKIDNYLLTEK